MAGFQSGWRNWRYRDSTRRLQKNCLCSRSRSSPSSGSASPGSSTLPSSRRHRSSGLEVLDGPYRQFGAVFNFEFAEDTVEILLDGAFGQVQLERDFFIQLGLTDQVRDLFFAE